MNTYLSHEEIHEQYKSLEKTLDYILFNADELKKFFNSSGDIVFVGCGSSYWMSLSAHKTMKVRAGLRSYAVKAGDVVLCPEEFTDIYDNPIFICPSRSGRTKEVIDAVAFLTNAYPDSKVFSIIVYAENELSKLSDMSLSIPWTNEQSVCQTRSFSNLYVAFIAIAAIISNDDDLIKCLKSYLIKAPSLFKRDEAFIQSIADPEKISSIVTLGGGLQYGVVIEGAYIVIEMAEFAANYYQLLEYRHGPIVTAGEGTVVFICTGMAAEHEQKMAVEIRETGAKVYAVAVSKVDWADHTFTLGNEYSKEVLALHFAFVMQSFAHHFSIARGKNPDSPGNLISYIIY